MLTLKLSLIPQTLSWGKEDWEKTERQRQIKWLVQVAQKVTSVGLEFRLTSRLVLLPCHMEGQWSKRGRSRTSLQRGQAQWGSRWGWGHCAFRSMSVERFERPKRKTFCLGPTIALGTGTLQLKMSVCSAGKGGRVQSPLQLLVPQNCCGTLRFSLDKWRGWCKWNSVWT